MSQPVRDENHTLFCEVIFFITHPELDFSGPHSLLAATLSLSACPLPGAATQIMIPARADASTATPKAHWYEPV